MKKKVVAFMIVALSITMVNFYTEEPLIVYSAEKTIDEATEERDEVLVKIREMEAETKSLQDKINSTQENIDNLGEDRIRLSEENENLESEIEALNDNKIEKYEMIRSIIRIQYEQKNKGYLGLLLESKNFTNFLTRLEVVSKLIKNNNYLIEEISKLESDLEEKSNKLQQQIDEIKQKRVLQEEEMYNFQSLVEERDTEITMLLDMQYELEAEIQAIQDELAASSSGGEYEGGEMAWPVPGYYEISSYFGGRIDPISGESSYHKGIDIPAPAGAPVVAANDGIVVRAEYSTSYGNLVVIDHGGGALTYYAHNTSFLVSAGQAVSKGESIATVGTTGYSTGEHSHFEVQVNGEFVDPMGYLS